MATAPIFTAAPRSELTQFVPGHGTRFRPLWTPQGAVGSRLEQIHIATNDAGANTLQLGLGKRLTLASNMGGGLFVDGGGGSDTITRASGSFITDGWQVGDRLTVLGATTLANDFVVILTGVAALTLTFATATVAAAEALPTTAGLYRLGFLGQVAVPAGSGSSSTIAVSGLDPAKLPAIDPSPDRNLRLGIGDVLFGAVGTLMGSSETLDVTTTGADY